MKKLLIWLVLALCLLGVAQAETIEGEWKFIGWVENGEFEEGTQYSSSWQYVFDANGRLTYVEDGRERPGTWTEKAGVTSCWVNGQNNRVVLRADGTLLIGSWAWGQVFSRDGQVPAAVELASGETEDGLFYEPAGDGSLKITGHRSAEERAEYDENGRVVNAVEIVIPASIGGVPVSMVDGFAFQGNKRITSICIEDGVYYVGRETFSECTNVAKITLPDSLTAIEGYAFSDCDKVGEIALPYGLQDVDKNPFASCDGLEKFTLAEDHIWLELNGGALIHKAEKELKSLPANAPISSYTVPANVTTIDVAAFMGCEKLNYVQLHDKVKEIGSQAFERSGLKEIDIPASVKDMNTNPFSNCKQLENVHIAEGNPTYYSMDGVIFDKEENSLLYYPMGKKDKSYTVPGSTKIIDFDAFMRQPYLREVIIEAGVESIMPYAFYGMEKLESIIIPETVTYLGGYAFCECQSLRQIDIPVSVPAIEDYTFAYGILQKLMVAQGTSIAENAFENSREEAVIEYK